MMRDTQVHPEVSAFFRRVGKGFRTLTYAQRSLINRLNAKRSWNTRRLRYGPNGFKRTSRVVQYDKWKADHGLSDKPKV